MSYTEADLKAAWDAGFKYGKLEAEMEAIRGELKRIARAAPTEGDET